MNGPLQTPFDTVENAQQYVRLLVEAIADAKGEIEADLCEAAEARSERRVQALRIVQFKLDKLEQHLQSSNRLLNDLRTLRRLLLDERLEPATAGILRNRDSEESGFRGISPGRRSSGSHVSDHALWLTLSILRRTSFPTSPASARS